MKYLVRQWKDFLFYFAVPFIAAMSPWRFALPWLRWWAARDGGPFDEPALPAAAFAPNYIDVADLAKFKRSARLIWLIDAHDEFLSLTRWRRHYWPRQVEQVGNWPTKGPFVVLGFHYGTGSWVFHSLARAGYDCMVMSVRWERSDYRGVPLRYWYGKLRGFEMSRVGGCDVAMRPGVREKLSAALAEKKTVLGLIDVPPRMAPRGQQTVRLLDRNLSFPDGLLSLAQHAGVPVVPYWIDFDLPNRKRRFCIGEPLDPKDVAGTLQSVADILDRQIRRMPEAWFFWPELPQWIVDAAKSERPD
jgi:hypothetical protein